MVVNTSKTLKRGRSAGAVHGTQYKAILDTATLFKCLEAEFFWIEIKHYEFIGKIELKNIKLW